MALFDYRLLQSAKDGVTANGFEVIDINFVSEVVTNIYYFERCEYLLSNDLTWDDFSVSPDSIQQEFEDFISYSALQKINGISYVILTDVFRWSPDDALEVSHSDAPFEGYDELDIFRFNFYFFIKRPGLGNLSATGLFADANINEQHATFLSLKGTDNLVRVDVSKHTAEDSPSALQGFIHMFFSNTNAKDCDVWILVRQK